MTRFNQLLIAALTVQIIIAGAMYYGNQSSTDDFVQTALLSTDKSEISRIVISNNGNEKTVLNKVNGQWRLPEYHNLPANQNKIASILDKFSDIKTGWPVATTENGRERFEVSEEKYKTKVSLANGDNALESIYLGTSPGFRQLHVRRDNEDEVYAVKLNSVDFPVKNKDWLDKTLLQPKGDIAVLQGPDFAFNKEGDKWKLEHGEGEVIKEEVENLVSALSHLNVRDIEEKTAENPEYELTVNANNDTYTYRFFKEGDNYLINRNDYPQAFKINKSDYENITGKTVTQLVKVNHAKKEHLNADNTEANKKEVKG